MNNYESHWRQALRDYTPAATDADWAAMRTQLPNNKPGGGRSSWWWAVVLLFLVGAGTQVRWDREMPPLPYASIPITTSPESIRLIRSVQLLPKAPPDVFIRSSEAGTPTERLDTLVLLQPIAPAAPPPTYVLHRLDLLPVDRLRPLRYRPLNRLDAIGKTLIVVPPEPESLPPVRVLRANGLYPPIRERKN